jgi:hypothetical protein
MISKMKILIFWTVISSLLSASESNLPIGKWNLEKSLCDESQYLGNEIELEFNENGKGLICYDKKDKVYFEWKMNLDTLKFKFTPENRSKGFVLGAEKFICLNGPFKNQMSLKYVDSKCRWILNAEK